MTLTGAARLAGVMGWPVSHSLSPRLHGYWLQEYGIDGAYVPLAVKPDDFQTAVRALPKLGFAGVNVTVPHKEAALAAVDDASPEATAIGAVNTIVVRPDGRLFGTCTDGAGFLANLRDSRPNWSPLEKLVAVLGAGGAAKAIAWTLVSNGATVRIINRTPTRADELAASLGKKATAVPWEQAAGALEDVDLLVNTTTMGMKGQGRLDLDLGPLPDDAIVTDIVYNPLQTDLLARAAARGNPVVDGLGMLLHQARAGFQAWFGREPAVTPALRQHVLAGLK